MLHTKQDIRFKCTACGQCCYGDKDAYIKLNRTESINIANSLNISLPYFKRAYLTPLTDGGYGIKINENGACAILGSDGKCRAYSTRPVQCRTYPYWPEILLDKSTWLAEKKRCEGINEGDVIDVTYIEKQLESSIKADTENY